MDRTARAYWDLLAARWRFSPPLSPTPEDIAWFQGRMSEIARGGRGRFDVVERVLSTFACAGCFRG